MPFDPLSDLFPNDDERMSEALDQEFSMSNEDLDYEDAMDCEEDWGDEDDFDEDEEGR